MERVSGYLTRAAGLRDKAQGTKNGTLRAQYLELAIAYEELAASITAEKRGQDPDTGKAAGMHRPRQKGEEK